MSFIAPYIVSFGIIPGSDHTQGMIAPVMQATYRAGRVAIAAYNPSVMSTTYHIRRSPRCHHLVASSTLMEKARGLNNK